MVYSALDDRPGFCEGCGKHDYPSTDGPSAKQITWNSILALWLCVDCLYSWSTWIGTDWGGEKAALSHKPGFLIMKEKENG